MQIAAASSSNIFFKLDLGEILAKLRQNLGTS